jgi:proline dehydrogenase
MSEINKIGLPKIDNGVQSAKSKKEPLATGKAFENQLLETVEKLKSLGNEVDAMIETTSPKNVTSLDNERQKIKRQDIVAENFSAAQKTSTKSAKFVALQYEQSRANKS